MSQDVAMIVLLACALLCFVFCGAAMDVSGMRRWTVDCEVTAFPCKQVRVDDGRPLGSGRVCVEINYLYHHLMSVGDKRTTCVFNKWFSQLLSEHGFQSHVVFRDDDSPAGHVGSLCTSCGLYSFLAGNARKSRNPTVVSACTEFLSQAARLVSETQSAGGRIEVPVHPFLQQRGVKLEYLGADRLSGFASWLSSCHVAVRGVLWECWENMVSTGLLKTALRTDTDENSFRDVMRYVIHLDCFRRLATSNSRTLSASHALALLSF